MKETLAAGLPPLFLVDEEYRLAVMAAEVGFIDGLIDKITNPHDGWAGPWAAHLAQTVRRRWTIPMPTARKA